MREYSAQPFHVAIIVTPNFNLAATVGFIDPLRAANYLAGRSHFRWDVVSASGGTTKASDGLTIESQSLISIAGTRPHMAVVSSSWTPESFIRPILSATLKKWARAGVVLAGIDTGAFILAKLGLLAGREATVHYEHIDAFQELYPEVRVSEQMLVLDADRMTCCGGVAGIDLGLHIVRSTVGDALANEAARYLFHERLRPATTPQSPPRLEPLGSTVPSAVRKAIKVMERNLENPIAIPKLCARIGISQRQLIRLFQRYVRRNPALYYRDVRLDRARGLVTQTDRPLSEVAVASGFPNQAHFSRSYRQRFGMTPGADRIAGRIPFEFRAWPMHHPRSGPSQPPPTRRVTKTRKRAAN